jgi:hypothetical protein
MQSTSQVFSVSAHASPDEQARSLQIDNLAYQAVTIAAILLVLGSLWVF